VARERPFNQFEPKITAPVDKPHTPGAEADREYLSDARQLALDAILSDFGCIDPERPEQPFFIDPRANAI